MLSRLDLKLTPSDRTEKMRGRAMREPEPIGVRLRRLRRERGLSQRELASPGVSYAYISRIEAGTRRPSVKALRMLARKLGVSPEYLETGSELRDVDERELRLTDAELRLRVGGEPEAARAAFSSLLTEATDAGDLPSATRARIGLGLATAQLGDHAEAARLLQDAIDFGGSRPTDRPDVYSTLARAYAAVGASERAIDLLEQCLTQIERDDPDNIGAYVRFAGYLSAALTDSGNLERAGNVLTEALARAEEDLDPYTRIRLYWSVARLAESEGRSTRALEFARRAIALLEATEDSTHLARAHLLCAWIMDHEERPSEALPHLEAAERLIVSQGDSIDRAQLRIEQAKNAALRGDPEQAVGRAREALDLVETRETGTAGDAWWALAEGLALRGEVPAAHDAFARSVELLDANGLWREASQACRRWAKVLRDAGRDAEALDALERATDYAVRSQPTARTPLQR
jgi:transcriptional regulator with XRE-family HTH domain